MPIFKDRVPSILVGNAFSIGSTSDYFDDNDSDEFDENFIDLGNEGDQENGSIRSEEPSRNYPITCTVIYPYQVSINLSTAQGRNQRGGGGGGGPPPKRFFRPVLKNKKKKNFYS